jgi:hypothetical protein
MLTASTIGDIIRLSSVGEATAEIRTVAAELWKHDEKV